MTTFTYDDIVTAKPGAPNELRPGQRAWVVGITEAKDRRGANLKRFPTGTVYLIEFEDGSAIDVAEADLIEVKS